MPGRSGPLEHGYRDFPDGSVGRNQHGILPDKKDRNDGCCQLDRCCPGHFVVAGNSKVEPHGKRGAGEGPVKVRMRLYNRKWLTISICRNLRLRRIPI